MRVEEYARMGSSKSPECGDKCTIHYYSDAEPAQVVKVSKTGKTIWIRKNVVTVQESSKGEMGHQDWDIHENEFEKYGGKLAEKPDNYSYFRVTLRKDGSWRTSKSNLYIALGQWHKHYDWEF